MADDNVTKFYPSNAALNPDNVLEQAIGEYEQVFVIGVAKDGMLDARASLNMKARDILYLIEQFKHNLMGGSYGDSQDHDIE